MTSLTDFPPDVQAAASTAHAEFASSSCVDNLSVIIARAIVTDRAGRQAPRVVGLTAHQKRVLEYLAAFVAENGIAPTYDQIVAHLGLASKSGVHRVIHELEERGAIQRLPNRARSITIIANPTVGA